MNWRESLLLARQDSFLTLLNETADAEQRTANIVNADTHSCLTLFPERCPLCTQETCIIFPSANIVFDSGRCPQRSVYRRNLFITHEHLDHMGGIPFHICTR